MMENYWLKKKFYIRRLKRNIYKKKSHAPKLTWKDMYDLRCQTQYKSTSGCCSCYMCSGYYKYRRKNFKKETIRILKENDINFSGRKHT